MPDQNPYKELLKLKRFVAKKIKTTKFGCEYTFLPATSAAKGLLRELENSYTLLREDSQGVKKLKSVFPHAYEDDGCLEIPTKPVRGVPAAIKNYNKAVSYARKIGFLPYMESVDKKGNLIELGRGGGHVHIESPLSWQQTQELALLINLFLCAHPALVWGFSDWSDDQNAMLLASDPLNMTRALSGFFADKIQNNNAGLEDLSIDTKTMCVVPRRLEIKKGQPKYTIEFRFFDMPYLGSKQARDHLITAATIFWTIYAAQHNVIKSKYMSFFKYLSKEGIAERVFERLSLCFYPLDAHRAFIEQQKKAREIKKQLLTFQTDEQAGRNMEAVQNEMFLGFLPDLGIPLSEHFFTNLATRIRHGKLV
jgi:hypothetical protein